jgi:acylphosphatase
MTTPEDSAIACAHLKIVGRVQGVYYRASLVRQAQQLRLRGWVRNCDDGSVESIAEGGRSAIDALVAWCRQGPPGARVDSIEIRWEAPQRGFSGFVVMR